MSEVKKQNVDEDAPASKEATEAGSNPVADTTGLTPPDESMKELENATDKHEQIQESNFKDTLVPLFLRDRSQGRQGNPQDEKDAASE